MENAYIADTPGFSMLDFVRFDFFTRDDLVGTMREFEPYIGECRFTKCSHTKEQGCAILAAIKEGKIAKSRHQSYVAMFDALGHIDKVKGVSGLNFISNQHLHNPQSQVADVGYDPSYGARPLKRAIQRLIEDPVSELIITERILSSKGVSGHRRIKVSLSKDKETTCTQWD
jgi:hypothetical protein